MRRPACLMEALSEPAETGEAFPLHAVSCEFIGLVLNDWNTEHRLEYSDYQAVSVSVSQLIIQVCGKASKKHHICVRSCLHNHKLGVDLSLT